MLVPLLFSFHPALRFDRGWRSFFTANLLVAAGFILWDMLFTHLGVWGFNPRYLTGIFVNNLPLEELLFFICIPYASVFTYHCLRQPFARFKLPTRTITLVLALVLLFTAVLALPRLYTSVTFALLAFLLLYLYRYAKPNWLRHFYLSYLVILLPFVIVNGILTGSWIDEPVVWYNNAENLGIRLLTIPLEDVFYGMLMLLLNTWLYERFENRRKVQSDSRLSV